MSTNPGSAEDGRVAGSPSIRWSLLRSFAIVVLISSLTVLVLLGIRASRTERQLSERLISTGSVQVAHELDAFVRPGAAAARVSLAWGGSGFLSIQDIVDGEAGAVTERQMAGVERMSNVLLPLLETSNELSSVEIANERSEAFLILETDSALSVRVVNRPRWGTQTLWFSLDADGTPSDPTWREVDYDPTIRDWYTGLEDVPDGTIQWTEPYVFFTTRDLGITASGAWEDGGVRHAISWDVLLSTMTDFTRRVSGELSPNARVLVTTSDGRAMALPSHPEYSDAEVVKGVFLTRVRDLAPPELARLGELVPDMELPASFSFSASGSTWWTGVRSYVLQPNQSLYIAVLVPDEDLLQDVSRLRRRLLLATALALAAAMGYALLLARTYSRPIEALAAQSRRIRDLDFTVGEGVDADLEEVRALAQAQEQSVRALQSFAKYVPLDVVSELVKTERVAQIGGRQTDATVLFSDIKGFTSLAERSDPEALAAHLAEYFEGVIDALKSEGATIDKLVGDAVMAFWGAPRPCEDHPARAVAGVAAAHATLERLNERWRREGRPELPTRFGLASGRVVVGNFGSPNRLAYTVFGDTVNLASRLEGLNKVYGTWALADENVVAAAGPERVWRRIDRVRVVGRTAPVWIYEPVAGRDESTARYEEAWDLHAERRFDEAAELLRDLDDAASRRLRELCLTLSARPPGPEWEAITDLTTK